MIYWWSTDIGIDIGYNIDIGYAVDISYNIDIGALDKLFMLQYCFDKAKMQVFVEKL